MTKVEAQAVGSEFQINTYTTSDQRHPSVASLNDGGFVVTWESLGQDGDSYGVYGQRYDSSGVKSGLEFQVNTYTTSDQRYPSVAPLNDGGFVVIWQSSGQDGDFNGVYGQRYASTSVKSKVEFQINTYTTSNQGFPSVALLNDGGFVVTWASDGQDGSSSGGYGQRYASTGLKSGLEFQVNTYTTSNQDFPSVAPLNDGGCVVTWGSSGQDGDFYGVYGQRYDSTGVKSGLEFQVNTYTTSDQRYPTVAPLNDGGFVVTWYSLGQDGDSHGVYGQRYASSTGVKSGVEFQVNTYTTSYQDFPSVAGLSDGGFVVTWHSDDQDGSSYGIYGQRYDSNGNPIELILSNATNTTSTLLSTP
ncbi:MAG: hypothetical protein K940chlam9_02095, partial [Chlamydiae bacterium]|nr:hypothetical protein [Chlamydiota bacterium]